jgi:glycosyltransferase involved in cell wall biosynthesis
VIVGSGPCWPALEGRARALGILEECVFQPATQQVPEWLHAIDIFVLPSLSEALSNSLMEAMACGCAVAASSVGGNPELVSDGETGMLFESGDAAGLAEVLRKLAADPALRCELAHNAVRLIQNRFTLEAAARRMGEIYAALLV